MNKKYELTDETIEVNGHTLHRIRALRDFGSVRRGDLGGFVEAETNLPHYGLAWVFGNAKVFGDAGVYGDAKVFGDAKVRFSSDYGVFKNTWSSDRYFTYTKSNKMWNVGCFYGTGDELIKKAYADSELSGKCYEAIVRCQENIEKIMENIKK